MRIKPVFKTIIIFCLIAFFTGAAHGGFFVSPRVSILDLGADLGYEKSPNFKTRLNFNYFTYSHSITFEDVRYGADLTLTTITIKNQYGEEENMMKSLKRGMFFLAIVSIIFISYMPKAFAGNYLGEFCWSIHKTEDEDGPIDRQFLMKIGITYMGGSYFTLQGIFDVPFDYPIIINGSGIMTDEEIILTMNTSHNQTPDEWRDTGTLQLRLNLSTLNGTFWTNMLDFNTLTREFRQSYAAGTATFTSCP